MKSELQEDESHVCVQEEEHEDRQTGQEATAHTKCEMIKVVEQKVVIEAGK